MFRSGICYGVGGKFPKRSSIKATISIIQKNPQQLSATVISRKFSTNYRNQFWKWTTQPRPNWKENYIEGAVACVIFAITGTSSVTFVRPFITYITGIHGSLVDGPNSYRVMSILLLSPMYAVLLFSYGTVLGRHRFFAKMSFKILNRFVPKSVLKNALCKPAKEIWKI